MIRSCAFVEQVKVRDAFKAQEAEHANRLFKKLAPSKQQKILEFFKQELRASNPPSLIGRVIPNWLDNIVDRIKDYFGFEGTQNLWNKQTHFQKAACITRFLEDKVSKKLRREDNDAKIQQQHPVRRNSSLKDLVVRRNERLEAQKESFSLKSWLSSCLPSFLKKKAHGDDICSRPFGIAHMQGDRPTMEDEHLITQVSLNLGSTTHKAEVFGIFDGHEDKSAATFAKEHFAKHLKESIENYNAQGLSDVGLFAAFKEAFEKLDAAYKGTAGTTMSVAIVLDGNLWTCNLGDARSVLNNAGIAIQLTEDQKCDNPKYAKGVKKRDGKIIDMGIPRVNGILAVPRALGDHGIIGANGENCIVHTPKITKTPLSEIKKGSHLIIACDGIWDVRTTEQAVAVVKGNPSASCQTMAQEIINEAYDNGSTDNLSALVVDLG